MKSKQMKAIEDMIERLDFAYNTVHHLYYTFSDEPQFLEIKATLERATGHYLEGHAELIMASIQLTGYEKVQDYEASIIRGEVE